MKRRRLELGLYQKDVAKLFGVTLFTIINWEKGRTEPTISNIPTLIWFLGYNPAPLEQATSIADHLRAWRRNRGLTQKEAARSLGIDPSTWSNWENGGTIMCLNHRRLVASFLCIPEEIIYTDMKIQWNNLHGKGA
ncbi:MAG: helix-turn-helix transcriptional regulator [Gammaproteobacteria bacterium]|nr:helix-turn-helix transcriptional regulator [Gammaproteobacteria bacterium]